MFSSNNQGFQLPKAKSQYVVISFIGFNNLAFIRNSDKINSISYKSFLSRQT